MERRKASDFPRALLDLFHEYQHGHSTGDRSSTPGASSPRVRCSLAHDAS